MKTRLDTAETIEKDWAENPRWQNVQRDYTGSDVVRLKGSVQIEYTLARLGAEKLWHRVNTEDFVPTLGALTGGQAVQQVKAGIKAIYLSGWQVAADANLGDTMYPDQSLYPVNSVPSVVRRITMLSSGQTRSKAPVVSAMWTILCPSWPTLKLVLVAS